MKSIIELAKQAGILEPIDLLESNQWRADTIRELEVFAHLVRAAVLEEAAGVCEQRGIGYDGHDNAYDVLVNYTPAKCAAAIRALKGEPNVLE